MKRIKSWILGGLLAVMLTATASAGDYFAGVQALATGDYATALEEFTPLAKEGNVKSQFLLGEMYASGWGVGKNFVEAVKWYRLAAEAGDPEAQSSLGVMYEKGRGVPQDFVFAHMWYNISAAQGDALGEENRDAIVKKMSSGQINESQRMAKRCLAQNYKGCEQ